MFGQLIAIARNTFLESVRQPIFIVLLLAGGLMQAFNTLLASYSMGYSDSSEVSGDNKLLLDMGLATVFVVSTVLAAFVATAVLSREIENKTALTVISKPIGRPVFILGKFFGAAAAVLLAAFILLVFFQLSVRQGVFSTARDTVDGPVIVFATLATVIAIGLGVWGNFFYGWVFSSTTVYALAPGVLLAWLLTLIVSPSWNAQPITTDLKPQVMIAGACVLLAMPVLVAVAIAASTRLGQVMTITVCVGAFILGLLSNHLVGRRAFENSPVAGVVSVTVDRDPSGFDFDDAGDAYRITLDGPPIEEVSPGTVLYYGPSPNGIAMVTRNQSGFDGDPARDEDFYETEASAIVVAEVEADPPSMLLRNAGGINVGRPPGIGDSLFLRPTEINRAAWAGWSIIPNLQFFWLVDAVTQAHAIPPGYLLLALIYSLAQVTGLLALAVILFQSRDVG
jgi:ABC-type transport system involved in multi-copper enzyme maturation permease subunit